MQMKSFIAKPSDIDRKWFIIDAEGKTLGKIAVEAAVTTLSSSTQRRLLYRERKKQTRFTRDTAAIRVVSKRQLSAR